MTHKALHITSTLAAASALSLALASCDNGCEQVRENYLHTMFTSASGRTMRGMEVIVSNGETGYQLDDITQFDDVKLDLNPNDSLCYMLITGRYTDFGDSFQLTDTVEVRYTTQPYYLDMNCGCTIHYELQSVTTTHHLFSAVNVLDPVVVTESVSNLEFIY